MRTVMIAVVLIASLSRLAAADDVDEARRENQKAVGAFALGNYAEAAGHYERAFALHPDAALLYNAAQSHRLAGNKPRALLLYENLERMFPGKQTNKVEIDRHIADLRAAIAVESKAQHGDPKTTEKPSLDNPQRSAGTEPSPTVPPATTTSSEPPSTPPPPAQASNAVTASPPQRDERPLTRKPWFWAVVGGSVVVVGLAVGLGIGLGLPPSSPTPSLGGVTVR